MKALTVKLPAPWRRGCLVARKSAGALSPNLCGRERVRAGDDMASCHDLMADVCGILRGPKDLSTNPKYLAGFGE
jgi:hypothetical protein